MNSSAKNRIAGPKLSKMDTSQPRPVSSGRALITTPLVSSSDSRPWSTKVGSRVSNSLAVRGFCSEAG
jgi:hypothetical protein